MIIVWILKYLRKAFIAFAMSEFQQWLNHIPFDFLDGYPLNTWT